MASDDPGDATVEPSQTPLWRGPSDEPGARLDAVEDGVIEVDWDALLAGDAGAGGGAAGLATASAERTHLDSPLPASGPPWPTTPRALPGLISSKVPGWVSTATGLLLSLSMVIATLTFATSSGNWGSNMSALVGKAPVTSQGVVTAYLQALADADASTALSYLAQVPANTLLLTDESLRATQRAAPIAIVSVSQGTASVDNTERVEATYRIGTDEVSATFALERREGLWRLRGDPGHIGLAPLRAPGIPVLINGVEVPDSVEGLPAFPGVYLVTTNNQYFEYSLDGRLLVRSPAEAPSLGGVTLTITDSGVQAAEQATVTAINGCLQAKVLKPPGCPQNVESDPSQPLVEGSVAWSLAEPIAIRATPTPRTATVTVNHTATWQISAQVLVDGTAQPVASQYTATTVWTVNMAANPLTATVGA